MSKTKTVAMVRDAKAHPKSHDANVCPDDVAAWKANGWSVAGEDADDDGLTKVEIHADLEAMGVDFDPRAKKADLLSLRNTERAKRDDAE
jgi:hypothetical protein